VGIPNKLTKSGSST